MRQTNSQNMPRRAARWMQVFVLAALMLGFTGCAEQPTMILIRGAALIGSSCTLEADPSAFQSEGILDVSLATQGYVLAPNVENVARSSSEVGTEGQAKQQAGTATWGDLGIEGNRVLITEAQVDYEGDIPLSGFSMPIGGVAIDPDGGTATFGVAVINAEQVNQLKAVVAAGTFRYVTVKVRLVGISTSDSEVESNEFTFPITICNGCLAAADCAATQTADRCMIPGQDIPYCPETTE